MAVAEVRAEMAAEREQAREKRVSLRSALLDE